jgi:hypothetical protein
LTYEGREKSINIIVDNNKLIGDKGAVAGTGFYKAITTKLKALFPETSKITKIGEINIVSKDFNAGSKVELDQIIKPIIDQHYVLEHRGLASEGVEFDPEAVQMIGVNGE